MSVHAESQRCILADAMVLSDEREVHSRPNDVRLKTLTIYLGKREIRYWISAY
jgi:hypothetical protein